MLVRIPIGHLQWVCLQLKKKVKHINHPIVHLYTICWNEERILPFFFQHYEPFVDQFTFYDNMSTDRTTNIITSHPNTKVFSFDGPHDNPNLRNLRNSIWKKSRGKADYVIVCDVDEFLYHPQISSYIRQAAHSRITLPDVIGYNMICDKFPDYKTDKTIVEQVNEGVRYDLFDKHILFDPHRIVEINYGYGSHRCEPCGITRRGKISLKLLHYKNMGLDYLIARNHSIAPRVSDNNKRMGIGVHYLFNDQMLTDRFNEDYAQRKKVID